MRVFTNNVFEVMKDQLLFDPCVTLVTHLFRAPFNP